MSTHEIKASDCTWAEIMFEDVNQAFEHAQLLEDQLKDPNLSPDSRKFIEECLDDLFSALFDGAFFND